MIEDHEKDIAPPETTREKLWSMVKILALTLAVGLGAIAIYSAPVLFNEIRETLR